MKRNANIFCNLILPLYLCSRKVNEMRTTKHIATRVNELTKGETFTTNVGRAYAIKVNNRYVWGKGRKIESTDILTFVKVNKATEMAYFTFDGIEAAMYWKTKINN